jgi:lipopolysaccharide biosynthesis protein
MRIVAFYLPQFYPIPENDRWWGRGFTEWTNVTRARPRFRGHDQPQLPADLGFYDLRVPEVRAAQAQLAEAHGISGFCYYHYWFSGTRLLSRPLDEVLRSGEPEFPFALCWANHDWTRGWDSREGEILVSQLYEKNDDLRHVRWLAEHVWSDKRHITVDGRPLFLLRTAPPDARRWIERWRTEAQRLGVLDPYLVIRATRADPETALRQGFDASVEIPPYGSGRGPRVDWRARLAGLVGPRFSGQFARRLDQLVGNTDDVHEYAALVAHAIRRPPGARKQYPGVTPRWDNSPRRRTGALIFRGSTPELYRLWLAHVATTFTPFGPDEDFVFVNAWNEWGEGAYLEPCQRWGNQYLDAHRGL